MEPRPIYHVLMIPFSKLFIFFSFVPGTSVMSVSATDADDPTTENAILSYSIIGQESVPPNAVTKVMFGINNETGTIYTRDVGLDREVQIQLKTRISAAHPVKFE